ncbi:MAG: hypothetical protein PHQ89_00025 [Bacilli bacterium]|nr:hypothetical protein [Bacilli bacterium]
MLFFSNIVNSVVTKFTDFYNNLEGDTRFAFYLIIIIVIIIAILIIVLIDQLHHNKKIVNKKIITEEKDIKTNEVLNEKDIDIENEKTRNLKEITDKLQEVINNKNVDLTSFEKAQEESSIISYNELLKTAGRQPEDENEETPFKLSDLARKIEADEIMEHDDYLYEEMNASRFKTTPIISPIFGIQDQIDQSLNIDPITKEEHLDPIVKPVDNTEILDFDMPVKTVQEEEEFLNRLKNLRNNLN